MANISQITIPNGTTYDIKDTVAREHSIEYIRGTWTAASGTWTGVTTDPELYDGKQIILYMPFNGSGNATLNLTLAGGGTTGAKDVYFEGTTRFTTHKGQNSHLHLIYHKAMTLSNGNTYEGWWYMMNRDMNDYYGVYNINGTYKTKTDLHRYQVLLTVDEEYLLPITTANNDTGTSKTLTTEAFDPFGQIFYYNSTNNYSAGDKLANWNSMWLFAGSSLVDLRFSFNTGNTLTANKAVYLVCAPQSNGLAKLHSAPIAQDLPTSDNGLIYIYLGQAYDNYRITWALNKTVYWYKNGCVREYTNGAAYAVSAGDAATVSGHTVAKNVPSDAKFTDTTALGSMTGTLSAAHGGTGKTSLNAAANSLMNALSAGSDTPKDADYYISQYAGGGTTTTTYHRRPMSALWSYIKGKADSVYLNKSSVINNLTTTTTGSALDASQGKALNDKFASYLPLSGGTLTGDVYFSNSGTTFRQIRWCVGANDYARIGGGATDTNAGYMEIATCDDGNEPIYVRQYTGVYTTLKRTLTLLDASGNTSFPGTLTADGGSLTLHRTSSIGENSAAEIVFNTTQTDNKVSTSGGAYIRVFDDHDEYACGTNMVIQSSGNMIIGGGESPSAAYTTDLKNNTGESLYLTADGSIYFYPNADTYANHKSLYIDTNGDFKGSRYIYATYLNQSSNAETPTTSSYIMYANSDGFLRKSTLANVKTILDLGSASTYDAATTVGNNTNLPTGAAIQTYVTGLGYTKNTGTVTKVSTGVGLTGGDVTTTGTIKAKLKSETASTLDSAAMGSTSSRQYAVGVDRSGYLSVNIPWTDTTALTSMTGTLGVGHGGTGATTLASGEALIGNGTGAVTTRAIRNNTSNGSIGWTSSSASTSLLTQNDIAYWNGRYNDTASNLQYTKVGELKAAATYEVETTVANDAKLPTGAAVQAYVTGLGYTKNTGTVTKVTAGAGLTGGNITTTGTIALDESGVTAGSAGPTAAVTGNDGTTVAIPRITVDKYGRVTALTSYNLTNKNTTYTIANNLTTTVAGSALDATQGKALNDKFGSYLPLAGGTVTGTLILSRTTDAAGTANNKPALIVGGTDTQKHIEIDNDEIHAKSNGTTTGALYLNWDGSPVVTGAGGIETKGTARIGATALDTGGCVLQFVSATNSLNFNFS